MGDSDRSATDAESAPRGAAALDRLAASAAGWHRIQLAVIGFIGFCGVFWGVEGSAAPTAVQWLAAALVGLAFVLACLATFLVGRVAYPYYGLAQEAGDQEPVIARRTRRLRTGIRATYLAVALLVVATLSSWWPAAAPDTGGIAVRAATGQEWCGQLVDAPSGGLGLSTAEGPITISLNRVASVRAVGDC